MPESKIRGPNIKYRPEVIAKLEEIAELKGISRNQAYEEALMIYIFAYEKANTANQVDTRPKRENWVNKWKGE